MFSYVSYIVFPFEYPFFNFALLTLGQGCLDGRGNPCALRVDLVRMGYVTASWSARTILFSSESDISFANFARWITNPLHRTFGLP